MSQTSPTFYEAIIVGGSYAGLSTAMSLGRARRRVLVIDSGLPRNRFTPHAHNLLLNDGAAPAALAAQARQNVAHYPTVARLAAQATSAEKLPDGTFLISTAQHGQFQTGQLLLATGLRDELPTIPGFAECWGKSIIHCPYCHGYEVADQPTGLWINGDQVSHMVTMLRNWTRNLTVFTNGPATFPNEVRQQLADQQVQLVETPISAIVQHDGQLSALQLANGRQLARPVLYAKLPLHQASDLPAQLGCALDEQQLLLTVDAMNQTSVPGVYAAGDNCTMAHQVVQAMAAGGMAGITISRNLIFAPKG